MPESTAKVVEFAFSTSVLKARVDENGRHLVTGVASDTNKDLQGDQMTEKAIASMVTQSRENAIPLFETHRETFPIGKSVDAEVGHDKSSDPTFVVTFELDMDYPQARALFKEINEGGTDKQLSIGGQIFPDDVEFIFRNDDMVREVNDVTLDHVAVTRKDRAANPNTGWVGAIAKALDGDAGMQTLAKQAKARREGASTEKGPHPLTMIWTTPDPLDGHTHMIRKSALTHQGNGRTGHPDFEPWFEDDHEHDVKGWGVVELELTSGAISRHDGWLRPINELGNGGGGSRQEMESSKSFDDVVKDFTGPDDPKLPPGVQVSAKNLRVLWSQTFKSTKSAQLASGAEEVDAVAAAYNAAASAFRAAKQHADPVYDIDVADGVRQEVLDLVDRRAADVLLAQRIGQDVPHPRIQVLVHRLAEHVDDRWGRPAGSRRVRRIPGKARAPGSAPIPRATCRGCSQRIRRRRPSPGP